MNVLDKKKNTPLKAIVPDKENNKQQNVHSRKWATSMLENAAKFTKTVELENSLGRRDILNFLPKYNENEEIRQKMADILTSDTKLPNRAFHDHELQLKLNNPNTPLDQLSDPIKSDPKLNMRIVNMANSPIYKGYQEIECFEDAFYRIGIAEIRNIVYQQKLMAAMTKFSTVVSWEHFWFHCVLNGRICEHLLTMLMSGQKNFGYINGLLDDVGKLVMEEYFPEEYMRVKELILEGREQDNAEWHVFGFTHAHVMGTLCLKWGFPYESSMGMYCHHMKKEQIGENLVIHQYAMASKMAEQIVEVILNEDESEIMIDHLIAETEMPSSYREQILSIDFEKEHQIAKEQAVRMG